MITQPYHLYVERKDATRNLARFYAIEIVARSSVTFASGVVADGSEPAGNRWIITSKTRSKRSRCFFISRDESSGADIHRGSQNETLGVVVLRLKFRPQRQLRADFFEHDRSFPQLRYRDHGAAGVVTFTRW